MPIPVFTPTFLSIAMSARTVVSAHLPGDESVKPGCFPREILQFQSKDAILKGQKEVIVYAWDPHITRVCWGVETGDTFAYRYEACLTIVALNGISHADRLIWQKKSRKYKYTDRFIDHALQSASGKNPVRHPSVQMIRRQRTWDSKHRRFWEFER